MSHPVGSVPRMTIFRGPVTVSSPTGRLPGEFVADFESSTEGRLRSWGGHIERADEAQLEALFELGTLGVELTSGRTGEAIVTHYHPGAGAVEVVGSGPPPF